MSDGRRQPMKFVAALSGFVGVGLGAFGTHALKGRVSPEMLEVFRTGITYQMIHTVALFALAVDSPREDASSHPSPAGPLFVAGILLFSGSLYVLALTGIRAFGAVTPLGGLCFLAGWLTIAVGAARAR